MTKSGEREHSVGSDEEKTGVKILMQSTYSNSSVVHIALSRTATPPAAVTAKNAMINCTEGHKIKFKA